jgi:hypothetical protein
MTNLLTSFENGFIRSTVTFDLFVLSKLQTPFLVRTAHKLEIFSLSDNPKLFSTVGIIISSSIDTCRLDKFYHVEQSVIYVCSQLNRLG